MIQQNELTPNQITWLNASGSREVKRLPTHFICVVYQIKNTDYLAAVRNGTWYNVSMSSSNSWSIDNWGDIKSMNRLRMYIESTFSGRYFLTFNSSIKPAAAVNPGALLVAFEDPSEASFFSLQIDYIVKTIAEELTEKK
jgi:hypothetical protein